MVNEKTLYFGKTFILTAWLFRERFTTHIFPEEQTILNHVLAIDPGKLKCGLALVSNQKGTIKRMVVPSEQLLDIVGQICREYPVTIIIIGDRTFGKQVYNSIAALGYPVTAIDEDRSSIEGRYRYLKENSKGLSRLLPIGLRVPKQPFDDYVAEILAERYLNKYPHEQGD